MISVLLQFSEQNRLHGCTCTWAAHTSYFSTQGGKPSSLFCGFLKRLLWPLGVELCGDTHLEELVIKLRS